MLEASFQCQGSLVAVACCVPSFPWIRCSQSPPGRRLSPVSRIPHTGRLWTSAEHQLCGETARGGAVGPRIWADFFTPSDFSPPRSRGHVGCWIGQCSWVRICSRVGRSPVGGSKFFVDLPRPPWARVVLDVGPRLCLLGCCPLPPSLGALCVPAPLRPPPSIPFSPLAEGLGLHPHPPSDAIPTHCPAPACPCPWS